PQGDQGRAAPPPPRRRLQGGVRAIPRGRLRFWGPRRVPALGAQPPAPHQPRLPKLPRLQPARPRRAAARPPLGRQAPRRAAARPLGRRRARVRRRHGGRVADGDAAQAARRRRRRALAAELALPRRHGAAPRHLAPHVALSRGGRVARADGDGGVRRAVPADHRPRVCRVHLPEPPAEPALPSSVSEEVVLGRGERGN
ncbi:hypothetical protein EMIHUDRAFT_471450, partial [Emiliania huxleyi CCMP1516]